MSYSNTDKEFNITRNLDIFSANNFIIIAEIDVIRRETRAVIRTERCGPYYLARLCAKCQEIRYGKIPHDGNYWEAVDSEFRIYHITGVEKMGCVDTDGIFYFEGAKSLRECLGWLLASSAGKSRLLNVSLLDKIVRELRSALYTSGNSKEVFKERAVAVLHDYFSPGEKVINMLYKIALRSKKS